MKITAMIPALLGSTRIPDKNLVLVDGKILCDYTIEACNASSCFTNIYLNSEDEIFSNIARERKVKFYKRNKHAGGSACMQKSKSRHCEGKRCVINDHYLYDFMKNVESDYAFQINSTSPLLTSETIENFVRSFVESDANSAFAIFENKAESFYSDKPLNFNPCKKVPSQELMPVQSICWAIAGWKCDEFIKNYETDDPETETPVFQNPRLLVPINEIEALDIDEWSTLFLCEELLKIRKSKDSKKDVQYLDGRSSSISI